ncbi:sensor histidine kinase [uncultured Psychroserpens sp.]|uniref:sensor histidine kinase n=1 Tax=uncultured Psychroserpens sp. TaxID=255436 RepID=UPI002627D5F8|nr:histidine kinase [uncultured Psychroserpens sp.]
MIAISGTTGAVALYLINQINTLLDQKISWNRNLIIRFVFSFIINFATVYIVFIFNLLVYRMLFYDSAFFSVFKEDILKLGILLLFIILMYTIGHFVLYTYAFHTLSKLKLIEQENRQINLKLESLKSQLTPHFLFNGLNAISSLIDKNKCETELFIRHLANLYKSILDSSTTDLIPLEKELEIVKSYTFLFEARFQNKFSCIINVNDNYLKEKIPPLTLQLLLENALKHNELREDVPLVVTISTNKNGISIKNNINKKRNTEESLHIGLNNIVERYKLLGKKIKNINDKEEFIVEIPFLV